MSLCVEHLLVRLKGQTLRMLSSNGAQRRSLLDHQIYEQKARKAVDKLSQKPTKEGSVQKHPSLLSNFMFTVLSYGYQETYTESFKTICHLVNSSITLQHFLETSAEPNLNSRDHPCYLLLVL